MQVQPASPGLHDVATHMLSWQASSSPRALMPQRSPVPQGQPSWPAVQTAAGDLHWSLAPSHTRPVSQVPLDWQ